jgi:hypothetical protein
MNLIKTKYTNWVQIFAIAVQVASAVSPVLPEKAKIGVALGLSTFQAILAALQATRNPDGTPATQAYVPPVEKQ